MSCPCKDCVCMAICRHKSYFELVKCYLLRPMFSRTVDADPIFPPHQSQKNVAPHQPQKKTLFNCLNPTRWRIDHHGWVLETGSIK